MRLLTGRGLLALWEYKTALSASCAILRSNLRADFTDVSPLYSSITRSWQLIIVTVVRGAMHSTSLGHVFQGAHVVEQ